MRRVAAFLLIALGIASIPGCTAQMATEEDVLAAESELVINQSYTLAARNSDGTEQLFGPGVHRASQGHFSIVGDNRIISTRTPASSAVRLCTSEGPDGTGVDCLSFSNFNRTNNGWATQSAHWQNSISFIEITPLVMAYRDTGFTGTTQVFTYGEHRANAGQLSTVGNDEIESIHVPPGVRVRACEHEGGLSGHGSGRCTTLDSPTSVIPRGTSYLDVQRVVSLFQSANLTGLYSNHTAGEWNASQGGLAVIGDNQLRSILVPAGLSAMVCPTEGIANGCLSYSRPALTLNATASSVAVTPFVNGTASVTVSITKASGAGGRVRFIPAADDCSGTCTRTFHDRSPISILAIADADSDATWTGCTRTVGASCILDVNGAASVSVAFTAAPPVDCAAECRDLCADIPVASRQQCINNCMEGCAGE